MPPRVNPFWRFSVRTYRVPGVQEACLALQEHCGADVNLLLFCGWTGRDGRELDEATLRSVVGRVGVWQSEVIAPLRLARRGLKRQRADDAIAGLAASLRKRVLTLELELERVEQSLLGELASQWAPPAQRLPPWQAITGNLACYLALLGEAAGPDEVTHLGCIAQACSPTERNVMEQPGQAGQ
jgi:uncharacterized protein (TIGR02444 family)